MLFRSPATQYHVGYSIDLNNNVPLQNNSLGTIGGLSYGHDTLLNLLYVPGTWSQFTIKAWVTLAGDSIYSNDTLVKTIHVIQPTPLINVGITNLKLKSAKTDTLYIGNYDARIEFKNLGDDTIKSMQLKLTINGLTPLYYNWSGILLPGETKSYDISNLPYFLNSYYTVCADILLSSDADTLDNHLCKNFVFYTSIPEASEKNRVILYQNLPNPADGKTEINFEIPISGNVKFQLTNMLGQILESQVKEFSSGRNSINLDVSKLPGGIYYYSIEMEGRRLVKKMIIE